MNMRPRTAALGLLGLGLSFLLTGSQIQDYPWKPTRFGSMEGTRKLYRDMKESEIKKIMKTMAAGIGVKCDYCHNEKNYASEEKPTKDFGRKKLMLLQWLNDKYRPAGAKWEYSCYTCHRGNVKPVDWVPPAGPVKVPSAGK